MDNIVSTEEFWELMQTMHFKRISEKKGVSKGETYYCSNPPDVDVKGIIKDIVKDLE